MKRVVPAATGSPARTWTARAEANPDSAARLPVLRCRARAKRARGTQAQDARRL